MRIVAGTARGRSLLGPKTQGSRIRPTADRVRETLFNVLGQWMEGLEVLDLFAGTGALALEALSRGATRAVLVDSDREATQLCRQNAEALGFSPQVEILPVPAERAAEQLGRDGRSFDLIFADPPYGARLLSNVLGWVSANKLLRPGAVLCVEHDKRETAPKDSGGLSLIDERRFGDTQFSLYRFA